MLSNQLSLPLFNTVEKNFASFYPASNKDVVNALQNMCADNPHYQQIYLWGESQSGKSHLLQATFIECELNRLNAIYLPLSAIINNHPDALQYLEQYDLICIDDIHLLRGKLNWQKQLFHLFNRAVEHNSRLLFAADYSPLQLDLELKDLNSRLNLSLVFALKSLSDEDKVRTLQLYAAQIGLCLSDEVGTFILTHHSRNMIYLTKLIDKLNHLSLQKQRRLTIPLVKKAINLV